jgi:hypothetical protein
MSDDSRFHVVAKAVRLEYLENRDEVYIVFKVIDEQFKKQIQRDWQKDVELRVVGKSLVKVEE